MSQDDLDVILIGCLSLVAGVLSKQFVIAHGISLPVHAFMLVVGVAVGAAVEIIPVKLDPMHITEISAQTGFNVYMCILMFDCAFNTEVHYLKIIAHYMFIIHIPMIVLIYFIVCVVVVHFPYDMSAREYIIVMSIIMTPGPHMMRAYLTPTNVQQDLKTLLEAEALFGNYIVYMVFRTAVTYLSFHRSVAVILQDFVFGALVGFLVGKIIVFWISKIFKDYVNQTTIVVAFIYTGFALSYLLGTSGFICVVSMGLVLSDQRASMSTQFIQILNTLLELLVFCMTSFTCVSAGIYFMSIVVKTASIADAVVALTLFIIQNSVRALVLLVMYQCSTVILQTKTNTVIIWSCNIRGSYSLMMAYTLLDSNFRLDSGEKLFNLVVMQIILSFFVNSVICSFVIGYLNEDTLSKKKWMIERAGRLMIAIRRSTIHSLRNSMSIADADWAMVARQTKLKYDFMKAYRYSRWLNRQTDEKTRQQVRMDSVVELRAEGFRQLLLSQKACYTRLFGEGILSRQSVMNLMYLVNQSIKLKKVLEPKDIMKPDDPMNFLNRLEMDLINQIQMGPPPLCIRLLIFMIYTVDNIVIIYAILFTLFDYASSKKLFLIIMHNCMMFLGYSFIVLFFIIKMMSFRPKNLWHYLHRVIVLVTFVDLMITAYPITLVDDLEKDTIYDLIGRVGGDHYEKIYMITSVFCILTRFLRSVQLVQIAPMLQRYLLTFVTHMQDKKVFIQCDMATGYSRGIVETMRKMNSMATDRVLLKEMKLVCHQHKLEVSQYLGLAQIHHSRVIEALKTKTALRLTLNALEQTLEEIKEMGILGLTDAGLVHRDISTKMMAAQNFQYSVKPSCDRAVLESIPWLADNHDALVFIEVSHGVSLNISDPVTLADLKNGHVLNFYTGDIIVTQGHMPAGIFVIFRGLVRVECVRSLDEDDEDNSKVPYYSKGGKEVHTESDNKLELVDFYSRGNIIGELAFLTEKPGHKTFRCATFVETFFITYTDMATLVQRNLDPLGPLTPMEIKMWKAVAIRQAVRIIHKGLSSTSISRITIFGRMSDSYIVDGNATRVLTVSMKETSAVVLIQGFAKHYHSEHMYMGPCVIPYSIQKLISLPEIGPRVVYLIVKSNMTEENAIGSLMTEEPPVVDEDDAMTLSSAASDSEPYWRRREYIVQLEDESTENAKGLDLKFLTFRWHSDDRLKGRLIRKDQFIIPDKVLI